MRLKFMRTLFVFRNSYYNVYSGWCYVLSTDWMKVERHWREFYTRGARDFFFLLFFFAASLLWKKGEWKFICKSHVKV